MPEKWTKRSRPPSSGEMKPKPFSSLNHLTVPVAMYFLHGVRAAHAEMLLGTTAGAALTYFVSSFSVVLDLTARAYQRFEPLARVKYRASLLRSAQALLGRQGD